MSNAVVQIKRPDHAAEERQDPLRAERAALAAAIEVERTARTAVETANENLKRGHAAVDSVRAELSRAERLVEAAKERDGRAAAASIRRSANAPSDASKTVRGARLRAQELEDDVEISEAAIGRLQDDVAQAATAAKWAANAAKVARNNLLAPFAEQLLERARAARRDLRVCEALAVEILDRDAPDAPSFDDEVVAMKARAARAAPLENLREQAMSLFRTAARNVDADDAAAIAEAVAGLKSAIAALAKDPATPLPT